MLSSSGFNFNLCQYTEVNTTINLPNFAIPVIVANVTFFCGVEVGEPNLLIKLFVDEPIGPIHGMHITDVELSAEAGGSSRTTPLNRRRVPTTRVRASV